ncbi:MAG TPA: SDR family oxidoreductase [Solirubrobacterales bacterium]|nr:SDR family oxidoreductase [Solirubrobacterales bacterium]
MDVLVAGGHGKVALRLLGLLAGRGDRARGLIRNPDHAADLERAGAEPVLFDLEAGGAPVEQVEGADAVVFAAGAGPGSGPERKRTVDLGGALTLIDACRAAGIDRYVIVSAIGVRNPGEHSGPMEPYLDAKAEADAALRESGLAYTIVRPGSLTDEPGSGRVEAAIAPSGIRGEISRDDVAATLLATLDEARTAGLSFDLIAGEAPIADAIAGLVSGEPGAG